MVYFKISYVFSSSQSASVKRAAARPAAELAGHARRRRKKMKEVLGKGGRTQFDLLKI